MYADQNRRVMNLIECKQKTRVDWSPTVQAKRVCVKIHSPNCESMCNGGDLNCTVYALEDR